MSMKSKGELLGNVPVDTGYTPGEPTGVRAVENVEYVTGPIHNRSLLDIWENIDELDNNLRTMLPVHTFGEYTSAGDTERAITGDVYTGESTSDDNPSKLYERFRVTDQFGQPLMVGRKPVIVKEVHDPSASPATVVGVSRQILSGATNLTFSLQTITHASAPLGFAYCKPGDTLVVSGGTSNDGTYVVEEVVSSLEVRVRKVTGPDDAFNPGTEAGTITVSTPEEYSHRIDATEAADAVVKFNAEIPAATVYQVHYFQGRRIKNTERGDVNRMVAAYPNVFQEASMQAVYDGVGTPRAKSPGREQSTIVPHENAIALRPSAESIDPYGGMMVVGHQSPSAGADRQISMMHEVVEDRLGVSQYGAEKGQVYTGLSVQTILSGIVLDAAAQHDGSDLTDIGSGIVQSSSTNWSSVGATVGMQLRIGTDATVYIVTEVAPSGDTTRLRVTPTPATFGPNEDFVLYSRKWAEETNVKFVPQHIFGVATLPLPESAAGSVTKGSTILEDLSVDFDAEGVAVGDKVYCTSRDMNTTVVYEVQTVAPSGNVNRLEMTTEFLETNAALSYKVYDPTFLGGRALCITDVDGAELTVQFLNAVSAAWSANRGGITLTIYDTLSALHNFLKDGGAEQFLKNGTHLSVVREGNASGTVNKGYQSVALLAHDNIAGAQNYLAHTTMVPAVPTKGLNVSPGNAWVYIGDITDNYAETMGIQIGDVIIPTVGPDKGTEFTVLEASGPYVKVNPTPSGSTVDYQYPFHVKRSPFYVDAKGQVVAKDFLFASPQDRETLIPPWEMVEKGAPNAAAGLYKETSPSAAYVWEAASTTWTLYHGLKAKPSDVIQYVEWQVNLNSSVSNPNTALTCGLSYMQIATTATLASASVANPYLSGSGTLTLNSRVVNYAPGGLSAAVYPGCFVILAGTGAWRVAAVLDDNNLLLAEDHGQATATTTIVITNGRPLITAAPLPAANWLFVAAPVSPIEVLSGEIHSAELNGPDIGDNVVGARVVYRGERF